MTITARFFGNYRNEATRYYWVQAIFPGGRSAIFGPASVTGPTVLGPTSFIAIQWEEVAGATGYDVIVTDSGTTPTGTITAGIVALNVSGLSYNDTGLTKADYV